MKIHAYLQIEYMPKKLSNLPSFMTHITNFYLKHVFQLQIFDPIVIDWP